MSSLSLDQSRQLDSIRGLSAIIVVLGHVYQAMIFPVLGGTMLPIGFFTQFAVMMFFSLSGFLVGISIFNNIKRNNGFFVGQYFRDRLVRIYPPLFIATLIMILLWKVAPFFFSQRPHCLVIFRVCLLAPDLTQP